jgi:sec-independent protein translocase protein TatC
MANVPSAFPLTTALTAGPSPAPPPVSWRRAMADALLVVAAAAQGMTFIEHLEELRRRILWAAVSVAVTFALCWMFSDRLYEFASEPIRQNAAVTLSLSRPQDIVNLYVKVTMVAAVFFSSPLILLQAWLFISPGLHRHERRWAIPFVGSASILFLAGGAFGYYVAFPTALQFLIDWTVAAKLTPIIDAVGYFDLFLGITVALGIVFQLPAVIFILSRIGLITARTLVRYLKHAAVGSVVVAAIITPTTDIPNMLIVAGPLLVLYGVGIGVAWIFGKRRVESVEHIN